jgi:transposase
MPKKARLYPGEFRQRIVELFRQGRSAEALARQFEPSAQAIRNWVRQADREEGKRPEELTSLEQEELRRLRRENRLLREEREILKKAAAWFAREASATPSKESSSGAPTRPSIPWRRCAVYWASPPAASTPGATARWPRGPWPTCT